MRYLALSLLLITNPLAADPPEIVAAEIAGTTVSVTLAHPDTGWDHYADGWRVELADGTVIGTRTLFHPHVEEQPFTRSLSDVQVPDGVETLYIRARDNLDGWAETRYQLALE